jgi:preprotein translocase subunit YajC
MLQLANLFLMLGTGDKPNPMNSVLFMVAMIAVMYFFMIRPQMKRAKEQKEFSNNTQVGDTIVTTAGFYGKIVRINDDGTLSVELDIVRNTLQKQKLLNLFNPDVLTQTR